ncbi:9940_t:CDS:2, partial [Acaulospora morrowiae]
LVGSVSFSVSFLSHLVFVGWWYFPLSSLSSSTAVGVAVSSSSHGIEMPVLGSTSLPCGLAGRETGDTDHDGETFEDLVVITVIMAKVRNTLILEWLEMVLRSGLLDVVNHKQVIGIGEEPTPATTQIRRGTSQTWHYRSLRELVFPWLCLTIKWMMNEDEDGLTLAER